MSSHETVTEDLWIFGYGSLMWDPGFPVAETSPAMLKGYHRRFSVFSNGSYGHPEQPGLALGLHPGGSCRARVFRVNSDNSTKTLAYLETRESAYIRKRVNVTLDAGLAVRATTFVSNPLHPRYAGDLQDHQITHFILTGSGSKGSSLAYLENTVKELEFQGVRKSSMHDLLRKVRNVASDMNFG